MFETNILDNKQMLSYHWHYDMMWRTLITHFVWNNVLDIKHNESSKWIDQESKVIGWVKGRRVVGNMLGEGLGGRVFKITWVVCENWLLAHSINLVHSNNSACPNNLAHLKNINEKWELKNRVEIRKIKKE